jgi:predicted acetyltransferase
MSTKEQVKALWKLCFHDSEEFVEIYFRLRYNKTSNLIIRQDGQVIAALQLIHYPMTFGTTHISTAYISGACTHPDHRNRGVMKRLLEMAHERMKQEGVVLSTLIPAEPWLFDYYGRLGYLPLFRSAEEHFQMPEQADLSTAYRLQQHTRFQSEVYRYFNRILQQRPYCIQHSEADFRVILADLRVSNGFLFTLSSPQGIVGLAVGYATQEAGGFRIEEILTESAEAKQQLLLRICQELQTNKLEILRPTHTAEEGRLLGMARVIQGSVALQTLPPLYMSLMLN